MGPIDNWKGPKDPIGPFIGPYKKGSQKAKASIGDGEQNTAFCARQSAPKKSQFGQKFELCQNCSGTMVDTQKLGYTSWPVDMIS